MTNCNRCGEECEDGEFEVAGELKYCLDCWETIIEQSHLEMVENEGGVACQAGIPLSENPYHADRMISEKKAWARGWCDEDSTLKSERDWANEKDSDSCN